jgi:hypothetical protein
MKKLRWLGRGDLVLFWYILLIITLAVGILLGRHIGETNHEYEVTLNHSGCTLVEVAQPDIEAGMTWSIGWQKQCQNERGEWIAEPLVEFGPEEAPEEVILRLEKMLGIGLLGGE